MTIVKTPRPVQHTGAVEHTGIVNAGGGGGSTPTFKDLFDGAAATLLTAHTPDIDSVGTGWEDFTGSGGSLRLDGSGAATGTGLIGENNIADTGIDSSGCIVKCSYDRSGSSGSTTFGKCDYADKATSNRQDGVVVNSTQALSELRIQSYTGGTPTTRDSVPLAGAVSDSTLWVRYQASGSGGVQVFDDIDAAAILEYLTPTATMTAADALYLQTRRVGDEFNFIEHYNTTDLSEVG